MKKLLLLLPVLAILFGCMQSKPGSILELKYQGIEKNSQPRAVKVAILDTTFAANNPYAKLANLPIMQLASASRAKLPLEVRVSNEYFNKYAPHLARSLASDIETILVDKGFKVYGRYANFDAIPYADKKNIELLVIPSFDFAPNIQNSSTTLPILGTINKGTLQLIGRVELTVCEPLSREKLVTKKIDVASSSASYDGDTGVHNALVDLLNATYPDILSKAAMLLDAEEMEEFTKHANEIKSKKVF